jgi:hypothetical protein
LDFILQHRSTEPGAVNAIISYFDKSPGKNMEAETPEELLAGEA